MNPFIAAVLTFLGLCVLVLGISLLAAYPMMWLINWIFAPSFLTFVFGVPKITFWTAWGLDALAAGFRATSSSSSEK